MKIAVKDFTNEFIEKKIANSKIAPNAVEEFIKQRLEIVEYIPFQTKREIVEMIVAQNVKEEDGVKKVDDIAQYLSFIVAMLCAHTNLQFGDKPAEDYDELNRCGLLELIVEMFRKDYSECEVLLKMAVANELQDNNLNVIVGKFLNGILEKIDGFGDMIKGFAENLDLSKLLGTNINEEEKAKFFGLLDKLNK